MQERASVLSNRSGSEASRSVNTSLKREANPFFKRVDGGALSKAQLGFQNKETCAPGEKEGTAAWIDYFDNNWKKEGLPQEWFNLKTQSRKRVGFVLDQQINLLQNPQNKEELSDWTRKTKRDLEGFKLEFLTDNVVYPRKYFWNSEDKKSLEDPLYGKAKDGSSYAKLTETVSSQERNGSVKESIENIQEFLAAAPDGSLAVMTSPLGPTGFKTQDGLAIDYPDSYFFVMQKKRDEVMNYTIKTDFTPHQCREVIFQLTGKLLPVTAPLEDYVRTLAFLDSGQQARTASVFDIVSVLEGVQDSHTFIDAEKKKTSWDEVRDQINKGEELYRFDRESTKALSDFEAYAQEGTHTKEDLHKAIAATILRLGERFFRKEPQVHAERLRERVWQDIRPKKLFGAILEQTAARRGCSGGGGGTVSINTVGGSRGGAVKGGEHFTCPKCHSTASGPVGDTCPSCGLTKDDYAASGGAVC